ncbi:MAG: EF-P lysine aminoacylase GenX [Planctomycetaceae bacterium]|nr:EF-P lysine aminoacylase GenX [Planctomycetaceae bacterium]
MEADVHLPTASLETLRWRSDLLRHLRDFFHNTGYWEAETPLLSQDTCVDAWLDPFAVPTPQRRYLQTSPEFAMKRLLTAGANHIYQVAHAFREGEAGERHNPEFTMVEWYARGATYHEQMDFTEQLIRHLTERGHVSGVTPLLPEPFVRITYAEAFERFLNLPILDLTAPELASIATSLLTKNHLGPLPSGLEDDLDGLRNLLLATWIEPQLASLGACFVLDFPVSQSALARSRGPVAERFELYLDGLEICNGYQELTDPNELRARNEIQNQLRAKAGKPLLPSESRLLAAMDAGFPESSGVALGWERLLMWLRGTPRIANVLPFPWDRA